MRERDVRFLDARIGLLIQNRMALEEVITFDTKFLDINFICIAT